MNSINVIQINLNRSWSAQDMLKQHMCEINATLAIISEPPKSIKETDCCFVSKDGGAAILWRPEGSECRCRLIDRGADFVAV